MSTWPSERLTEASIALVEAKSKRVLAEARLLDAQADSIEFETHTRRQFAGNAQGLKPLS